MSSANNAALDELGDLVERYARLADRHDGDAIAALFVPDGRVEIFDEGMVDAPPTRSLDRTSLAAEISSLASFRSTLHFLGQHHAELDSDDRAHGETYCEASHVFRPGPGAPLLNHVVALRYFDDYVRTEDGWRFARRRLDFAWVEQRPLATAADLARVPGRGADS